MLLIIKLLRLCVVAGPVTGKGSYYSCYCLRACVYISRVCVDALACAVIACASALVCGYMRLRLRARVRGKT